MSRLLVTRPTEDAAPLAAVLAARGHEPVVAPLMTIVPRTDAAVDLDGVQALLFTSANGVRVLAGRTARRDLPAFAVGDATAAAAREAGFAAVEAAGGTAEDLARLVEGRLRPAGGALLHVAGAHRAGDLVGALAASGFAVRRAVLYEARAADRLPAEAASALGADRLDGVLLFSPRTAKLFVRLVEAAGMLPRLGRLDAVCLSAAVAHALPVERWRAIFVAERPESECLLALLGRVGRDRTAAGDVPPADHRPTTGTTDGF